MIYTVDFMAESQPRTSPELLGAAAGTPTLEAGNSTAGMAPREGSDGEMWRGEDLCQGPSLVISEAGELRTGEDLSLIHI